MRQKAVLQTLQVSKDCMQTLENVSNQWREPSKTAAYTKSVYIIDIMQSNPQ